jgi:CRISPR/Cas system-associated exonuclease Cas4 (RecB family)
MTEHIVTAKLYGGRVTVDFNPRNHRYYVNKANPDGVTTICNATISKGETLADWIGRVDVDHVRQGYLRHLEATSELMEQTPFLALCEEAEKAHQRIKEAAGDSGSITHDLIEKHLTGKPYEIPDDERVINGFAAYLSWREQTDVEMIDCERIIYSETYFYCGKTDLLGRRKSRLMVGDFKTGNSAGYESEWYQLAGYAVAIEEETGDKIEDGLIIHLDKNTRRFKEYPVTLDDDLKGAWKAAVIHYKNLKRVKKAVKELKNGQR